MSRYSRYYEDRARYGDWEGRMHTALRGRAGFAWGAFFLGFILGGIIF